MESVPDPGDTRLQSTAYSEAEHSKTGSRARVPNAGSRTVSIDGDRGLRTPCTIAPSTRVWRLRVAQSHRVVGQHVQSAGSGGCTDQDQGQRLPGHRRRRVLKRIRRRSRLTRSDAPRSASATTPPSTHWRRLADHCSHKLPWNNGWSPPRLAALKDDYRVHLPRWSKTAVGRQ